MSLNIPPVIVEKQVARYRQEMQTINTYPSAPVHIITLSRDVAAGGHRIAENLGTRLGYAVWDREILDVLADRSQGTYQSKMFEALDEKKQNSIDSLVADFFGQVEKHTYFHLLPKAIYLIAQNNAIIVGRGAHLLLPAAFRIRICASMSTRTRNLTRTGMDDRQARDFLKKADRERDAFIREMTGKLSKTSERCDFDLVVNTDTFSTEEATDIILRALDCYRQHTPATFPHP